MLMIITMGRVLVFPLVQQAIIIQVNQLLQSSYNASESAKYSQSERQNDIQSFVKYVEYHTSKY